ncbi:NUDIX hydrolase [Paenibacillus eucommiae]|uniref:ADP-ribose pyrophosphatase YjhB (NUDIX family) n=1 Tax=Paenibacillus eucommiae TaxID=1355755 RepID=A0ABS4IQH2_9BACL|nr:NUDIX hydrolase [Paenibacillus eucommiae]MBP1989811.1 ADP-ribose pyrophosphatase YjhB (NUDIX family) [Paenibacillus eucommiae]
MGYIEELRAVVGQRPLILVGAVVIVVDSEGKLLLQQRKHPYGKWGIPGGLMELGESVEETARRELYEETKLTVGDLKLINIYSGPGQFIRAANGDEYYAVTIAYYTNEVYGNLIIDDAESLNFEYFHHKELPEGIVQSHKKIIQEFMDSHYRAFHISS